MSKSKLKNLNTVQVADMKTLMGSASAPKPYHSGMDSTVLIAFSLNILISRLCSVRIAKKVSIMTFLMVLASPVNALTQHTILIL